MRRVVRMGLIGAAVVFLLTDQSRAQAADASQRRDPTTGFICQLTIDGLEGNRSELRPGAMLIQSYAVEALRPSLTAGPLQSFLLTVKLSIPQISPLFIMANASGVHFGLATLQCMTQTLAVAYQWTLSDVMISSYKSRQDATPGLPTDEVSLSASRLEFTDLIDHLKFSWDAKMNQGGLITPAGTMQYLPLPMPAKPALPGMQSAPTPVPLR